MWVDNLSKRTGLLKDDNEAEDVLQQTYVSALARRETFRADSRLGASLTRIAINEALLRIKKRQKFGGLELTVKPRAAFFSSTESAAIGSSSA